MKEQLRQEIGLRMRELRKILGYTQEQMVSHFMIGRANYSRIEKGEIFPGTLILHTLKKKFDVSLDWLISNEGEMFLQDDSKRGERTINFGEYGVEVRELLAYMDEVPMVKHAILGYFLEYKLKNKEYLDGIFKIEGTESSQGK